MTVSVESAHRIADQPRAPKPAAEPLITAENVSVRYPRCVDCSLSEVSLSIYERERVSIIGPSGGGKTTLLRVLEGSIRPTSGQIIRSGKPVLVYQDLRLVAEQTVLANICSGAFGELNILTGVLGFPVEIRKRARELLADLGLARLADRKVGSLSGGQRQRVAIARALCSRPQVLLADEPLASLDPKNARRILELLAILQKKYGFALVVSTHNPNLLKGFFVRTLSVHDGRVFEIQPDSEEHEETFSQYDICIPSFEPEKKEADLPAQDRAIQKSSRFARWARRSLLLIAVIIALAWSATALDLKGSSFAGAFHSMIELLQRIAPASWSEFVALPWKTLALSLVQTIQMAILGTSIGIVLSLPLAALGARQTGPPVLRSGVRLFLNGIRTVPSIFWALIFVALVGLGPIAGVFALAAYSVGYLTKFFYEGLEDIDNRPASALKALGANQLQIFLWAIFPAARPALLGSCLFMLEYNVRSASVLGVVGAGGIGQDLMYYIDWREFPAAAAGLVMILAVVVALDAVSQWWRRHLTRQRGT